MASLRTLINNKASTIAVAEGNIEKGQIFLYSPGYETTTPATFCWVATATGQAIIEVWGASGSGGLMCCCGGGLPGNPGAYSKKTISVTSGCFVCGTIGMSCGAVTTLCYRGRSEPTTICWTGSNTNGCICAEGGIGGVSFCSTGSSLYCCFAAASYCGTLYSGGCGIICNFGTGANTGCCAQAYGGDTNCFGGFSCTTFNGPTPDCICCCLYHVNISPGVIAKDGAVITYTVENNSGIAQWSGQGPHSFQFSLNAAGRTPLQGVQFAGCWSGGKACGCYESHGCQVIMPPGIPGLAGQPCSGVRDHSIRGSHGAVRIKFIG